MNLATDPWIPILRPDGTRAKIAPWEITGPVRSVDSARTPWNGALTEFLVSLFQTVLFPEDARVWREFWNEPPSADYLKRELAKIAPLFELSGKRPFMQDPSLLSDPSNNEKYLKPVQKLLVDGVSENKEKHNADLFTSRHQIQTLCLPCAAAALWDLQSHSPQGSAGYYTALRGGGPTTTLILAETLWRTVWANVLEQSFFDMKGRPDPEKFLPWMKPENRKVSSKDESPLHVIWGMPRRMLLKIEEREAACDTCGEVSSRVVPNIWTYRGGFQYVETDWKHPCSPYVRKKDGGWCVRSTEGDLVGYRHWMGLLVDTPGGDGVPAFVVRRWLERDVPKEPFLRIWGYGYSCDQAAVNSWCEGKMPILALTNGHQREYEHLVITLVTLSQRAVEVLSESVYGAAKSAGTGKIPTEEPITAFWRTTEPKFLEELRKAAAAPSKDKFEEIKDGWMDLCRAEAWKLYEHHLTFRKVPVMWAARYAHKLRRRLSSRDPITLKTRKYGDWRLTDA